MITSETYCFAGLSSATRRCAGGFCLWTVGACILLGTFAAQAETTDQAQIDFANGLFHRGFFTEAADEYRTYLKQFPDGAEAATAWYRLGESEYAAQNYQAAFDAFEQLKQKGGDADLQQRGALSKGEVLYYLKRLDEAATVLEPLSAADKPADVRGRALYYLGKIDNDAGRPDAALEKYNTLIKELPDHPLASFAQYQIAFVRIAQNDLENAAIAFSAVATSNVDEALRMECRFRAAETYDRIGWFSSAVKEYERLQKEFPDSDYARRAAYGYAWALYHAGKFEEAAVAVDAFVKKNPDAPQVVGMLYLRANCLQQQQKYDEATALYRSIQADHPDTEFAARSRYKLAWVLYLSGKPDEAKQEATAFLQDHKNEKLLGDAAFLLGTIEASEGNYEDAYEEFRLVAEKYPNAEFGPEALYKAGECLAQLGRTEEAGNVFKNFAAKYPEHALASEAILRTGDADFAQASFDEAVAKYKQILESPADPNVMENTLYRLAITYHNMKDYKDSAETFQKIVAQFPKSLYVAEAQLRTGDYYLKDAKDPLKSIEYFEAARVADPKGSFGGRALKGLALARYETKDYDAAADLFLQLLADFPTITLNEETYAWAGQHFFDQKKWDEATKAFDALLRANPEYPNPERVRFNIAECSESAGKTEEAISLYKAVVDTAPASTLAITAAYRMGQLYEKLGKADEAFAMYEQAANANNGDAAARARYRLGELYEKKGEFESAAKSYMRIAILFLHEELSPPSLWHAGQCFEKAEKPDQARKTYQELVDDYPENKFAAQAKERLGALPQE